MNQVQPLGHLSATLTASHQLLRKLTEQSHACMCAELKFGNLEYELLSCLKIHSFFIKRELDLNLKNN